MVECYVTDTGPGTDSLTQLFFKSGCPNWHWIALAKHLVFLQELFWTIWKKSNRVQKKLFAYLSAIPHLQRDIYVLERFIIQVSALDMYVCSLEISNMVVAKPFTECIRQHLESLRIKVNNCYEEFRHWIFKFQVEVSYDIVIVKAAALSWYTRFEGSVCLHYYCQNRCLLMHMYAVLFFLTFRKIKQMIVV